MAGRDTHGSKPPEDAGPAARWLRPLGVTTMVVIVVLSLRGRPSPELRGDGLVVTIALVALVGSMTGLLWRPQWGPSAILAPIAMIFASSALVWTQNGGPAMAGIFAAVGYAALRLPFPRSLGILALAVTLFASAAAHAHRSTGVIVSGELGVAAFYMLASFARRVQEAHEQTTRLVAELEATRKLREEAATLRERSRIAREIHDVLAHSLSGLVLQLEGARMLASSQSANGQLPAALDRAQHLARAGLEEARRAVGALRDEDLPGPERLAQLVSDFTRDSGIQATLAVSGTAHELDPQASLTIYRVAQEALTNSRRHARPQLVELRLSYERDTTRLVVQDHGERVATPSGIASGRDERGGDPAHGGYGLTGMRERAELLGGRLHAAPTDDGFHVELWVPA